MVYFAVAAPSGGHHPKGNIIIFENNYFAKWWPPLGAATAKRQNEASNQSAKWKRQLLRSLSLNFPLCLIYAMSRMTLRKAMPSEMTYSTPAKES